MYLPPSVCSLHVAFPISRPTFEDSFRSKASWYSTSLAIKFSFIIIIYRTRSLARAEKELFSRDIGILRGQIKTTLWLSDAAAAAGMNSVTKGDGLHMTSAEGGGVDYPKSRQKNGRSTVSRGERGQNPLFLANVICEWLHRRGGRVKEGRKESLRNLRYGYVRWRIRRQKDGKGTLPSPTIFPGFQTNCSGSKMTLKGDLLWGCHARHRKSNIFLFGI